MGKPGQIGGAVAVQIAMVEPDALKAPYKDYLSGKFPDYINSGTGNYRDKKTFVNQLIIDLDRSNLNNVDKRVILTNLYIQLMGVDSLPDSCPPNKKTLQDPSLSFKLWNVIDGIKTPYAPFKVEDINLGYSGQGNPFIPLGLIPPMEGRSGSDYIGYVDAESLFNLELYVGDPNNDESDEYIVSEVKSIIQSIKEDALFISSNSAAYQEFLARQHAEGLSRIGTVSTATV